jgi:hypothetical protein
MDWAWTTNDHDERPVEDINEIVLCIESYVTRRGGALGISLRRIRNQIIRYVCWRMRHAWMEISPPQHAQTIPMAWTEHAERVWSDWLLSTFQYEDWVREVIVPVFGTDERFWEARISTQWRHEIYSFLPFWIERDWDIVDDYDPSHIDDGAQMEVTNNYDDERYRRR